MIAKQNSCLIILLNFVYYHPLLWQRGGNISASIAVGGNINYQLLVYGSFVWGIHLRYNNRKYHPSKYDYHSIQDNTFDNHHLKKFDIYLNHFGLK